MPTCSLREHSARLTQDDGGWLLRYPIARHQYGSREVELVEVMIPLVAENYAGARKLAMLILKDHRPPTLSESEFAAWRPPVTPVSGQRVYGGTL
jgi:hypothetical protein